MIEDFEVNLLSFQFFRVKYNKNLVSNNGIVKNKKTKGIIKKMSCQKENEEKRRENELSKPP